MLKAGSLEGYLRTHPVPVVKGPKGALFMTGAHLFWGWRGTQLGAQPASQHREKRWFEYASGCAICSPTQWPNREAHLLFTLPLAWQGRARQLLWIPRTPPRAAWAAPAAALLGRLGCPGPLAPTADHHHLASALVKLAAQVDSPKDRARGRSKVPQARARQGAPAGAGWVRAPACYACWARTRAPPAATTPHP